MREQPVDDLKAINAKYMKMHSDQTAARFNSCLPFVAFLLMLCVVFGDFDIAAGQDAPSNSQTTEQTATEPGNSEDKSNGQNIAKNANADPTDADLNQAKKESWIDQQIAKVDGWFGRMIVGPMYKVIFFPIYTSERTIKVENPDTGETHERLIVTKVPFVVAWLFVGATFFTLFFGFINIRGFWHAIRLTKGDYDDVEDEGEVSHFQALSSALSGTVGLGNIAGVAIAIAQGGPGATFWMIVVGLLGMTSKFTECTLGQMYRKVDDEGRVSGGPMRYLHRGLAEMKLGPVGGVLAILFAILCIGGSFGGGNTFQISQSLDAVRSEIQLIDKHPWIYGLGMATLVGLVIVGGIRSIGSVAAKIVPFMCLGYVLCAVYILINLHDQIPNAVSRIFNEAFTPDAMYGGFIGCLVIGIKRAVFSNEAGAGSASIAHSAARTDIPVREGYVALLEPFIDTVIVCTMTALVIVITGVVDKPERNASLETLRSELQTKGIAASELDKLNESQVRAMAAQKRFKLDTDDDGTITVKDYITLDRGAYFTKEAFVKGGHSWFRWFLYAAVMMFAYSTCISWYYYGERCFTTLLGQWSSPIFKVLFLVFTFLGSIVATTNIKDFSDMLILSMAFPNMLGMYFLCGKVKRHLKDYQQKLKSGEIQPNRKK